MGRKLIDISGQKFGSLTAIKHVGFNSKRDSFWTFKCDCGVEKKMLASDVKRYKRPSCGCAYNIDHSGNIINKIKILKKLNKRQYKNSIYLCECYCGTQFESILNSIKSGNKSSCGCANKSANLSSLIFYGISILRKLYKQTKSHDEIYLCSCRCGKIFEQDIQSIKCGYGCGCARYDIIDRVGTKFGCWTVIYRVEGYRDSRALWLYRCECGKEKIANHHNATASYSCGCKDLENKKQRMKNRTGKNHPNYNPYLTEEQRQKRRLSIESYSFSLEVFNRDNFTCQICGNRGCKLNAHHLDGYHWCKEKRQNIDNGITLCVICHKTFHNKYGRKNNTKEQFLKFKEEQCQLQN